MYNFFGLLQKREVTAATSADAGTKTSSSASYGSNAVQANTPSAALQVSAWYRASEVLANTMSQLQMEYQKKNDRSHGQNWSMDDESRGGSEGSWINYLLQVKPNATMDATQFWKQLTLQRFFHGNGVIYVERDLAQSIVALWLCSSASLVRNAEGLKYLISYNTPGGMRTLTVDDIDVIHWRNTFSNDNGLTGIGTIRYAANALSTAATNDKQAKENSAKGGKQKLLLREDSNNLQAGLKKLNKDQKTKQRDELQEAINNNQDVLLMSGLMDATVISQDAAQMQLLDNRKYDTPQIARFTGVPPVLLMDYTNNTYKAPEQANQEFLMHTITPMAKSLETEFNAKLISPDLWRRQRYHFTDASLMRLDPLGRANLGKVELETGIKCVNELRAERDLPAIEHGDRHFISTNLQPVDAPVVDGNANKKGDAV